MCGIAALLGPVPGGALPALRAMCDAVRHRGPDDEGFALFPPGGCPPRALGGPDTPAHAYGSGYPYAPEGPADDSSGPRAIAALGHRRLSIVDVSPAGHNPMSYDAGRLWITYNGEVYNYLELRSELEALGHAFVSHTDTEVILAAWRQWGRECLNRLNGMFAFALVDRERRTFFAARDRWGIKPLYYWVSPAGFVAFASEVKQLTGLPGWEPRINGQRAYDFLNWRVTDHTDETLFRGVFQLRGGQFFEAPLPEGEGGLPYEAGGRIPVSQWYTLRPAPFEGTFDEAAERFRELLTDSVRLRLRADVPVGSCLSGGLDSSSIVCVMDDLLRRNGGGVQKTFSACSQVPRFDERRWMEEVVAGTAIEPHYVYPPLDGAFSELGALTWHQDEPFASTSIYAQWSVFRLARQNGVTVMLDGQGADEQLVGYHNFFGPHFAGLFAQLRWGALWREIAATHRLHGYSPAASMMHVANVLLPRPVRKVARRLGARTAEAPGWMDLRALDARPSDPFADRGTATPDVRALSIAQLTATNLQMLLHWEDRDSMAHSIESRVPFLDYRLVEFVLGLPVEYKLAGGMTKRVLREGMRGVLPEPVRTRVDKLGFATPEEVWVREEAPDRFRAAVRRAVEVSGGILTGEAVEKTERILAGTERFEPFPWRVISFATWLETFGIRG